MRDPRRAPMRTSIRPSIRPSNWMLPSMGARGAIGLDRDPHAAMETTACAS
jgi:hypothetical protein